MHLYVHCLSVCCVRVCYGRDYVSEADESCGFSSWSVLYHRVTGTHLLTSAVLLLGILMHL